MSPASGNYPQPQQSSNERIAAALTDNGCHQAMIQEWTVFRADAANVRDRAGLLNRLKGEEQ
jgi:hypothetical protein